MATRDETVPNLTHALMCSVLQHFVGSNATTYSTWNASLMIRNPTVFSGNTTYHFALDDMFNCVMYEHKDNNDEPYTTEYAYREGFVSYLQTLINNAPLDTFTLWMQDIFDFRKPSFYAHELGKTNTSYARCVTATHAHSQRKIVLEYKALPTPSYRLSAVPDFVAATRSIVIPRAFAIAFYDCALKQAQEQQATATREAEKMRVFIEQIKEV